MKLPKIGDEFVTITTLETGQFAVSPPNKVIATGEVSWTPEMGRCGGYKLEDHEFTDGGSRYTARHLIPVGDPFGGPSDRWPNTQSTVYALTTHVEVAKRALRSYHLARLMEAANELEGALELIRKQRKNWDK